MDAAGGPGVTGNAPFVFVSTLESQTPRWFTVFVQPEFGALYLPALHWGGLMVKLGDVGAPIPAGTQGLPSAFEVGVNTAQRPSDMAAPESGHAYGATVEMRGGAPVHFLNATATIADVPVAWWLGMHLDVQCHAAGTMASLIGLTSDGTVPVHAGVWISPNPPGFDYGLDLSQARFRAAAVLLPNGAPIQALGPDGQAWNVIRLDEAGNLIVGGPLGSQGFVAIRPGASATLLIQTSDGLETLAAISGWTTGDETPLSLRLRPGEAPRAVSVGPPDSAGPGYRILRVPN